MNQPLSLQKPMHWTAWLLLLGIASLALAPQYVLMDRRLFGQELTTVHHLLVLVLALPHLIQRGLRQWWNPIFVAYSVLLIFSFSLAQRPEQLETLQSFRSMFSFLLAPLLFQINLQAPTAYRVVQIVAFWHISNTLIGLLILPIGGHSPINNVYLTWRFQGGSDTSDFAISGLLALVSCLVLARQHRGYYALALLALVMVLFTFSRVPAVLAVVIVCLLLAKYQTALVNLTWKDLRPVVLWASPLVVVIAILSIQGFIARTFHDVGSQSDFELSENIVIYSSGRLDAWRWNWERAMTSPVFGLGVGAGTLPFPENPNAFRTPLNEFLRLLVDGGWLGLGLVLLAYAYTFWWVWLRTPPELRLYLACLYLVYGVSFSFFNALSNQQFAVNFWMLLSAFVTPQLLEQMAKRTPKHAQLTQ